MRVYLKRYLSRYKAIGKDFITGIGLIWLIVEMASHSSNGETDIFTRNLISFAVVFILGLIYSFWINKPKNSFSYQLRNKDNFIEIKVGDIFKNDGALVIPINDHFDVSLEGNVKKTNSLKNQLIKKFYSCKERHLEKDIQYAIGGMKGKHNIGKVAEIDQGGKIFYLLVNSRKKENNRVESTLDDFLLSLSELWEYMANESRRNHSVTIPLINTNHGRIPCLNRAKAAKDIIRSYIESSKRLNISDKLIVSIHPDDLSRGTLNLDEIEEFLKFYCKHYRKTDTSQKPEGKEVL